MPGEPGPGPTDKAQNPCYAAFDLLLAQLLAHEEVLAIAWRVAANGDMTLNPPTNAAGKSPDLSIPGFIADISELEEGRYVRLLPAFRVPDTCQDARTRVALALRKRCCNWILQDSFESFREYVVAVDVQLSQRALPRGSRVQAAAHTLLGKHVSGTCPPTLARDGLKPALRRIRKISSSLRACENRNAHGMRLQAWLPVLTGVRNAIAHSSGIIAPPKLRRLDGALLVRHFPGSHIPQMGYAIEMTEVATRNAIERLREYGLAIYKAASAATGSKAHLLGPDGTLTVWRR